MALPYPMSPVSPFDVITSQAENEKIANIEAIYNGELANNSVTTAAVANGAITADKIDFTTLDFGPVVDVSSANLSVAAGGSQSIFTNATGKRVMLMLGTTDRASRLNVRIGSSTAKTVGYLSGSVGLTLPVGKGESVWVTNPLGTASGGWLELSYRTVA